MTVGADYVGSDMDYLLATGADYVGASRLEGLRGSSVNKRQFAMARSMPAIFLGFDQTVAASTAGVASSEGNVSLRPTDLVIRSSNAADWQITNMVVGRVNLLAGATGIPAEAFNTSVVRPPISAPELKAGTAASINLTNLTAASSRFMAMYTALDLSRHPVSP
jgi:hypothetical protein